VHPKKPHDTTNHQACSADEDKHTKHRHTVEFSKDNHTRLHPTPRAAILAVLRHRTTRFRSGRSGGRPPNLLARAARGQPLASR